ncbi:MAG: hypothetical protein ACJAUL_003294, partial [Paraglaciecola sp.]
MAQIKYAPTQTIFHSICADICLEKLQTSATG